MNLSALLGCLEGEHAFEAVRELSSAGAGAVVEATASVHPLVVAELVRHRGPGAPVFVVTATGREAEDVAVALPGLVPQARVVVFPSWETLPHERLSPSSDTVGRRVAVMRRLAHPDEADPMTQPIDVVVTSVRAFLQPVVVGIGDVEPLRLVAGDQAPLHDLVARLVELGYERTDLVERRGQVAVRGGILDVFPPTEEHPLRLEFWGDTVEEIRSFAIGDQRSLELAERGLWAPAVRELLLTPKVRERAASLGQAQPSLAEMCDKLAMGIAVEGMESLAPVLADGMATPLELVSGAAHVVLLEPERVRRRAHDIVRTAQEFLMASWHNATVGNATPIDLAAASYRELADMREIARQRNVAWWQVTPLLSDAELDEDLAPADRIRIPATAIDSYRGDSAAALADMRTWAAAKTRVVLLAEGHGSVQRLVEELADADVPVVESVDLSAPPDPGLVTVTRGRLLHGFSVPSCGLTVVTETDIVGQRTSTKDMRRLPSRRRRAIDPLTLKTGDYVVHEQHGVGRYVDMVQRAVAGAEREYLVLEYASSKRGQPADRLFVPMDQLDLITRYVGGRGTDGPSPRRRRLAEGQGPSPEGGQADRRRADPALRGQAGEQGLRVLAGHALAARARGCLPVRRDP